MMRFFTAMCALLAVLAVPAAQAGTITDSGTSAYWGADAHGNQDVIGGAVYDISGATITRVGSVLTITIKTAFAGNAGIDAWADQDPSGHTGIAYGDLFLAKEWKPNVVAGVGNYLADNALNGTKWDWGFSLDNRWSNAGGTFKLYTLDGKKNADNILNSEQVLNCSQPCTFRNGQAAEIKTTASSGAKTVLGANGAEVTGRWDVNKGQSLTFTLDMTGTSLINLSAFAMHWGETCQNDVIEGFTRVLPLPGSAALLAIGMGAMLLRRRQQGVTRA